jgi:hypothetical protein
VCEPDSSSSGQGQVTGSCEHGIEVVGAQVVVRMDTVRYFGVTPEERLDGTHWIGSMGSSAGLDTWRKERLQALLEREKLSAPYGHFMQFV